MKNWRIIAVFIFMIIFATAIIGRLAYIQIVNHDFNKALAQGQQNQFNVSEGERGRIFFKNGEILATNTVGVYAFVSPIEVEEKERAAKELSLILQIDEEVILAKLNKDTLFEKIKNNINKEEEQLIEELAISGIYSREELFRNYPQEEMASQVVGFFGGENKGQYGIEEYYDDILRGKKQIQKKERGLFGSFFGVSKQSNEGSDIILTLDYNIQFMAESLLKQAQEDLNIESGQIIVMEPASGKILAMASWPNFNPNNYAEIDDFDIFQNSTIQKLFEPGSVMKPITMAAAIDKKKITPQTTYIDTGKVKIGKYTIENYNGRVFGERTMTEVLERSINTGAVFAERQLGHKSFLKYLDSFGFFDPTGVDLEGEVFSNNSIFKRGYEINFATAAFGQGIEITPMHLIKSFTAITNQGSPAKPYVVDKIITNGQEIETIPEAANQVISSKTASQITAMLISVLENGYSKAARIPGYYIAGKTGTAQIPWSVLGINQKGYSDKTWQSFIGFAPALSPRFIILVKLDNPETRTAEYSALPLFRDLSKYIIDYWNIPPDYEE